MNLDLFLQILNIDSTSSTEGYLAQFLSERLSTGNCNVTLYDVDCPKDLPSEYPVKNVLFSWGKPKIVFCTHLDTVPPYIPPTLSEDADGRKMICGRGSCDAKGQIFAMYNACLKLEADGETDFGLLLLAGEETGSYGAKSYRRDCEGAEYVIVGEPTDNKMVTASKGTKSFDVAIIGKSFHSGYPQYGVSAVEKFVDLMETLRKTSFPVDSVLGETTWNVGLLSSNNPQNILSNSLTCRIYFRTTFASDDFVVKTMLSLNDDYVKVTNRGGDTPSNYLTVDGFETTTVAFGSDAPQLTNFRHKLLCGPGSILVAHTPDEFIYIDDLEKACENYVRLYKALSHKTLPE
jgi:acetylornithine deacetylase